MSDRGFDFIAQAMLKQKQLMDELENENRELRRQITDLRAGYGIFIEVEGKRFPIKGEMVVAQATPVSYTMQPVSPAYFAAPPLPKEPLSPINEKPLNENRDEDENRDENEKKSHAEVVQALEVPVVEELPLQQAQQAQQAQEPEKAPTFLEEIMIDEFTTASTSPMAVWKGASKKPEQEQIDEEQKAALRRELMGSFLLE
jgi:hypothetical protein